MGICLYILGPKSTWLKRKESNIVYILVWDKGFMFMPTPPPPFFWKRRTLCVAHVHPSVGGYVVSFNLVQLITQKRFGTSLSNFWNYFVWLRITDKGSVPEMRIWSILLIKSNLRWCIRLSRSLFLYLPRSIKLGR